MRAVVLLCIVGVCLAAPAIHQSLIDEVNNANAGWTAGVNCKFQEMSLDEVKPFLGVRADSDKKWAELPLQAAWPNAEAPLDDFDARTKWPKCTSIGEVRDQAACGSCWAFGAVEAMTDRHCIASNATKMPHLSAEDMNSCCSSCGFGCEGGYPSAAWQYWVSQGVVDGGNYNSKDGCFPYSIPNCDHHCTGKYQPCGDIVPTPSCSKQCQNGKQWAASKLFGSRAYGVSGVPNIQKELQTNGPVEAAFTVYQDFLTYKSGVYSHTSGSQLGGHAVKILGWGTEGGKDFWLVANSWNEDWGDKGYFKILRGKNECGIEGQIVAGTPK
jgi:cathepsin B